MLLHRDKVKAFHGSWGSGIATLEFESGKSIHMENNTFAVGNLIEAGIAEHLPGHCIQIVPDAPDIVWFNDDFGLLLGGFVLYQDWLDAGKPDIEPGGTFDLVPEEA